MFQRQQIFGVYIFVVRDHDLEKTGNVLERCLESCSFDNFKYQTLRQRDLSNGCLIKKCSNNTVIETIYNSNNCYIRFK